MRSLPGWTGFAKHQARSFDFYLQAFWMPLKFVDARFRVKVQKDANVIKDWRIEYGGRLVQWMEIS
jgi:hypothetical protein